MTNRQIETSREIRLWLGQLIVPAIGLAAASLSLPVVRDAVNQKLETWQMNRNRKKVEREWRKAQK